MANITCCELIEIFSNSVKVIEGLSSNIDKLEADNDLPIKAKQEIKNVWVEGAKNFAFLVLDKMWKEERFCFECETQFTNWKTGMDNNIVKK